MSTTTPLTPTCTVNFTVNGTALSSFPSVTAVTTTGSINDLRPGSNTWQVDATYNVTGHLQERLTTGGTLQNFNSVWTGANPSSAKVFGLQATLGTVGSAGATFESDGNYSTSSPPSSVFLGAYAVEIRPYAQGMVARDTGSVDAFGSPVYTAVPGVKVSVFVTDSGGGTYYLLDGNAVTAPSVTTSTLLSGPTAIGLLDYPSSATTGGKPCQQIGNGAGNGGGAAVPARAYDPYFGRTPTAAKSLVSLTFVLEFPSGRVWTAGVTANQNYVDTNGRLGALVTSTTGLSLGTVMSGSGGNIGVNYNGHNFHARNSSDFTYNGTGATANTLAPLDYTTMSRANSAEFLFVLTPGFDEGAPTPTVVASSFRRDATGRPSFVVAA